MRLSQTVGICGQPGRFCVSKSNLFMHLGKIGKWQAGTVPVRAENFLCIVRGQHCICQLCHDRQQPSYCQVAHTYWAGDLQQMLMKAACLRISSSSWRKTVDMRD